MTINPTTELEKELLAALGEQVLKVRKLERALDAALEVKNPVYRLNGWMSESKAKVSGAVSKNSPTIDPMAVDPRSVV